MTAEKGEAGSPAGRGERRHNFELRERLDELIDLARQLSRDSSGMTEEELEAAVRRIEWLADEIWQSAVHGPLEGRRRPSPAESTDDSDGS